MEFTNRLTENARSALSHSEILAFLGKSDQIQTAHILLAIIEQTDSVASQILGDFNVDSDIIRNMLDIHPGVVVSNGVMSKSMSDAAVLSVRLAAKLSDDLDHQYCGTAHILYTILTQRDSRAYNMLLDQGINVPELAAATSRYLDSIDRERGDSPRELDGETEMSRVGGASYNRGRGQQSMLARFSRNLTQMAAKDQLDPVIGRASEIDRMITILSQRTKNNPILIGEAGVGKTAVVEGLAQRIHDGQVPSFLADMQIVELDLASMVAGSKYRGEFEDRFKRVIAEIEKANNIIAFIDEIHLLVGAGSAEGSMDAANILKPALARGQFRLIGATTIDEYRRKIEKDSALNRRLREVEILAPNESDTIKIIEGIADEYREFHGVRFGDDVIREIVRLSERYITDRQQPDKSIDVLDETAARLRVKNNSTGKHIEEIRKLTAERDAVQVKMDQAVASQDYEHAALFKMSHSRLQAQIDELESLMSRDGLITIRVKDVADTISRITGVPVQQLKRSEAAKLLGLEKRLGSKVIGQSEAISAVAHAIRRTRSGVASANRPMGSFIFLGPTGVGKTELAKVLSEEVFGSKRNLIRVDMSELGERHNVARLIGAPAGYVGYEDGGNLVERIRRQPYSVVLFDEIEKAHPDVFNVLLQILEDGVLTDGHGKKADFRNSIIILTSNIGAENLASERLGFGKNSVESIDPIRQQKSAVIGALKKSMRPELINRFDKIVVFDALTSRQIAKICDLMIGELNERLLTKGISINLSPRMKRHLISVGYDAKYGARPLRRAIQDNIETELADQIIGGKLRSGDIVTVDYRAGQTIIERSKEHAVNAR